jgi:spore maturation protein CgeB
MRILFISSGFLGIYPYLENSIVNALKTLNHSVSIIAPIYTNESIEWIEGYNPDFVLSFVGYKTDHQLLQVLKKKGVTLGVWLTEDPYYIDQSLLLIEDYEYIFTIDLAAYEFYKERFPNKLIHHLPLGTDLFLYHPSIHVNHPIYDVCLVGYPYPNRIELIKHILDQTPYSIVVAGPEWHKYFNKKCDRLNIVNKWLEPDSVNKVYSLAKIILNPHRSFNFYKNQNTLGIQGKSINNRTFDIAASGGFQLIENKIDLNQHFDTSQEIVPYSNFDDCIHLLYHFLLNEQSRLSFSKNARERVLHNHTFTHRVEFILKQLNVSQK